jgi:hypothetical protein
MKQSENILIHQVVVQGHGNIVSDMDGEKVMLSIQNGKYYNFGVIGGKIWNLIEEPISIQNLVQLLQEIYDVDQTVCKEQVIAFLTQLKEEGLIQIADMSHSKNEY